MRASNYLPVNGDFFTKINEIVSGMNKIHQIHSLHFSRQEVKKFSFWLRAAFNAAVVVKIYCTLSKFFCRCQKRGHTQIRLEAFLEYDLLRILEQVGTLNLNIYTSIVKLSLKNQNMVVGPTSTQYFHFSILFSKSSPMPTNGVEHPVELQKASFRRLRRVQ